MKLVALVVLAVASAVAFATQPAIAGTTTMWWIVGGVYAALGALAVVVLGREGSLRERLAPRWGDLSMGALSALVLLLGSWVGRSVLAPVGSPEQAWVYRVYLALGSAEQIQRSALLTAAVLGVSALEELVWRGLVQSRVEQWLGDRAGWPIAALLYALALVPTAFTLRDPTAGLNPLAVIAALGCGLVWGFLTRVTGRLPPAMVSHMAFTYFTAAQFRLPGLGA